MIGYVLGVGALFYYSLFTRRPEERNKVFQRISTGLGLFMLVNFGYFTYLLIAMVMGYGEQENRAQIMTMAGVMIVLYILPSLFKMKDILTDIIFSVHHYVYYSPAYMHTLLIFAFCNVDDLSWGTKGSDSNTVFFYDFFLIFSKK